jgi:hypothetical protein
MKHKYPKETHKYHKETMLSKDLKKQTIRYIVNGLLYMTVMVIFSIIMAYTITGGL